MTRTGEFAYAGAGPFGRRVAEFLAGAGGTPVQAEIGVALASDVSAVVVALWRPDDDLCEQADTAAYRAGRPWLPIVMEHPVIYVGPLIRPPHGPCFRCMRRRQVQHDVHHVATSAMRAAYAADQDRGPAGYLPQHARMAAAIAHRLLRQPDRDTPGSADVCMLMLPGRGIMTRPVIRCGDCRRCGGPDQPAGQA